MTKEQQSEAARRIMEANPMTDQERQTYELLMRRPEDYLPPDNQTGERVCGVCGEVFQHSKDKAALDLFADHQTEHNPSPAQWGEAHRRIQIGKDAAKHEQRQ
jgi:hypothetical protein